MPSAERVHWAKFRAFAVILLGLALLLELIWLLTGGSLFQQQAFLYLYVPDASGLAVGAPVRDDGVDVGKVKKVELTKSPQPDRVIRLTLSINRGALSRIPADSNAQLSADTMVGDMFVDISSGTSSRHLKPGEVIPYLAQPELLKTLDLRQFDEALRSMDVTLTEIEQGKSQLGQFVMGRGFYDDLRRDLRDLQNAVNKAAGVTGAVGQPLYTDTLYQRVRAPILALDQSLASIQAGQGSMGALLRDSAQYEHFRALAQDLRASIASMRSSGMFQSDRMYQDLSASLAGLIRSIDNFNASPMMMNSSAYDNLAGSAQAIRDSAAQFLSNPKAYLRMKMF
jgi:phospholipid/cholesterol/gamma-HCH transport system substrate-binding protein